jgi:hypothetical protein
MPQVCARNKVINTILVSVSVFNWYKLYQYLIVSMYCFKITEYIIYILKIHSHYYVY